MEFRDLWGYIGICGVSGLRVKAWRVFRLGLGLRDLPSPKQTWNPM